MATCMLAESFTAFILLLITIGVWYTTLLGRGFWKRLYVYVPPMILLFLIPSLLGSFSIIRGGDSAASQFALHVLLPITLLLLTMTINFRDILALGRKSILIFLAGTVGIIVGGPLALWLVSLASPDVLADRGAESVWRGLVCISGSWINGTPGQTSMKEIFGASNELYFIMLAVDTVIQNMWLALLFVGVRMSGFLDRVLKADPAELMTIQQAGFAKQQQKVSHQKGSKWFFQRLMVLVLVTGVGYFIVFLLTRHLTYYFTQQHIPETSVWSFFSKPSFWQIFFATTLGIILSFTRARELDEVGATKIGNFFFFFLFATIGLKMNIFRLGGQWEFVIICIVWLVIHFIFLMIAARLLKGSFFFVAVGSQANIGGPATASMVAGAFNPHLASMGVLLGVLSNVIGNYCGLIAGMLYRAIAD